MKKTLLLSALLLVYTVGFTPSDRPLSAQSSDAVTSQGGSSPRFQPRTGSLFCSYDDSTGKTTGVSDLKTYNLPANKPLDVTASANGGIAVIGENRTDVELQTCVQAWGSDATTASRVLRSIKTDIGTQIHAEGPDPERTWSVSFRLRVPARSDLTLKTTNGGISVEGVSGKLNLQTLNGGLDLLEIGGNVVGRSTNGGINAVLAGATWTGAGLDLQSRTGGIILSVPRDYSAHFEVKGVPEDFRSEIEVLSPPRNSRQGVTADLNRGGPPIKAVTDYGNVIIRAAQ